MKKNILITLMLLFCLSLAAQQRPQPTPEQIQAYLASLKPDPEAHTLLPNTKIARNSPYRSSKNFGKRIAVFGGSLSVNDESDAAKQIWADLLGAEVVTYGVGGAGFSREQGCSLQRQVDSAGVYDIYILWASTNDYTNSRECGNWQDYTVFDGYDEARYEATWGFRPFPASEVSLSAGVLKQNAGWTDSSAQYTNWK